MRFEELLTPCYVVDAALLVENCEILQRVQRDTGCKILLAQKAFSCFAVYGLLEPYLAGTEASGLYEARLGKEEMCGEVHVFSAAYRADQFDELLLYADHIIFNSFGQLEQFGEKAKAAGKSVGLRVNPKCSTQPAEHVIYDPCAPGSHLGVTRAEWDRHCTPELFALLDGVHFHTLCEQNSDALEVTLDALTADFGDVLPGMKWVNFGGGHHITRPDYDIERLESCIDRVQKAYGAEVYLEPGEAIALNAGYLVTTVLDIFHNDLDIAILDTSAACHMPDVLEIPYLPPLLGAGEPGDLAHTYRLCGPTCLAGDVIGDYSFSAPLKIGDRLVFGDMAIYSMVKNNTFNGMKLPDIVLRKLDGDCEIIKQFGYEDFKGRLS